MITSRAMHSLGLALVPGGDGSVGVFKHLGIGRAAGGGVRVGQGLPVSFHFAGDGPNPAQWDLCGDAGMVRWSDPL
jgi:hypothetical protein